MARRGLISRKRNMGNYIKLNLENILRHHPKICVNLRCSVSSIIHYFRGLHKFWDGVDYMYRVY